MIKKLIFVERKENDVWLFSKVNWIDYLWIRKKWIIVWIFKDSYLVYLK